MTKQAWFCPACQKHHAPHVDTCPEGERLRVRPMPDRRLDAVGTKIMPSFPPLANSTQLFSGAHGARILKDRGN